MGRQGFSGQLKISFLNVCVLCRLPGPGMHCPNVSTVFQSLSYTSKLNSCPTDRPRPSTCAWGMRGSCAELSTRGWPSQRAAWMLSLQTAEKWGALRVVWVPQIQCSSCSQLAMLPMPSPRSAFSQIAQNSTAFGSCSSSHFSCVLNFLGALLSGLMAMSLHSPHIPNFIIFFKIFFSLLSS